MSRDKIEALNIPNEKLIKEDRSIITANNQRTKILESAKVRFCIRKLPEIQFEEKFFILDEMPVDANLGYKFLEKNDVILDLKKRNLRIINLYLDFDNKMNAHITRQIDSYLLDKNLLFHPRRNLTF